ncbi:MAG: alpha-ketoglutarate-dependent dioxygenase AlkB [Myxococcales bacterium]|nr:alpha-ketoglutarate-dependent dioxygenase AlkB [Myxococcales bacterium]
MTPPPAQARPRWPRASDPSERGLLYVPDYLTAPARAAIEAWLATLTPLWEQRYSTVRPPPPGRAQRPLLRPVYWLGNWQFACLGYYEPPRGVRDRCVAAEPFPACLTAIVADAEARVRARLAPAEVPRGWHLNTCLVNFYGDRRDGDRWVDAARVGEHRDFEPGPVVSLSLGERALFQFVARGQVADRRPVRAQWLDDGSLQAFGGRRWKDELLHRVQRVDHKRGLDLPPRIDGFRTRRVNFTFRFVPPAHVVPLARLGPQALADVRGYVAALAVNSPFFARALSTIPR